MSDDRLLISNDVRTSTTSILRVAQEMGYETLIVPGAEEFLEQVRAWAPTHIMLDLSIPAVDGLSLLSHLAGDKCLSNIILIGGDDRTILNEARHTGLDRGLKIVGALTKPMRDADLHAALNAVRHEGIWLSVAAMTVSLEQGEFHLHYQPKIDLRSGEVTGFEALTRWTHPTRGAIPPSHFIPFAELSAFIDNLTNWLVGEALRQLRIWHSGDAEVDLALNISARNLHGGYFAHVLEGHCRGYGIAPERITLELTETAATGDALQMEAALARLRLKGFKLSIDDFGTGYSSFLQLHKLPFSEIKIDRSFVSDCVASSDSRSIVALQIQLAHALGMKAVAEGVESSDVLDLLLELGCDEAQGYLIAHPMPAEAVLPFLTRHEALRQQGTATPPVAIAKTAKFGADGRKANPGSRSASRPVGLDTPCLNPEG